MTRLLVLGTLQKGGGYFRMSWWPCLNSWLMTEGVYSRHWFKVDTG